MQSMPLTLRNMQTDIVNGGKQSVCRQRLGWQSGRIKTPGRPHGKGTDFGQENKESCVLALVNLNRKAGPDVEPRLLPEDRKLQGKAGKKPAYGESAEVYTNRGVAILKGGLILVSDCAVSGPSRVPSKCSFCALSSLSFTFLLQQHGP